MAPSVETNIILVPRVRTMNTTTANVFPTNSSMVANTVLVPGRIDAAEVQQGMIVVSNISIPSSPSVIS